MKNWIYPTIVFMFFLYAMAFVFFYTYKGQNSYSGSRVHGSGATTSVESFQAEINKRIK